MRWLSLMGFGPASWPGPFTSLDVLGLRIITNELEEEGFRFGDFAVVLKKERAQIKAGDWVALEENGEVILQKWPDSPDGDLRRRLIGRILRSWRDY